MNAADIRNWANENEVPIGRRGRIAPDVKEAYFKANPATAREVAVNAGIEVPKRGRLSAELISTVAHLS